MKKKQCMQEKKTGITLHVYLADGVVLHFAYIYCSNNNNGQESHKMWLNWHLVVTPTLKGGPAKPIKPTMQFNCQLFWRLVEPSAALSIQLLKKRSKDKGHLKSAI